MRARHVFAITCIWTMLVPAVSGQEPQTTAERAKARHLAGHSRFGEAFDEGPRERPAKMTGIGVTHFPITTSTPEVQQWFDQGHTLLHSFWYYEAERAFRWAAKLDPEAPMPYWGLVRSVGGGARARAFMKEATRRKAKASDRERAYIEAWEHVYGENGSQGPEGRRHMVKALENIVMKYPDDIEAKALLAHDTMGSTRLGTELMAREVLKVDPKHPGAHHYRIHNWDDEDGALALDSCRVYGDIVPGIGHALHMPGHIYAGVGMFHESAISLDSATRAEIGYMGRQMVFLCLCVSVGSSAIEAQGPPRPPAGQQVIGVFVGTLPCADCTGLKTELTLFARTPSDFIGGTFFLRETYLATRDGDKAFESSGRFAVVRGSGGDGNATVYQLDPDKKNETRYFLKVGDDQLRMLDRERTIIDAPFDLSLRRVSAVALAGGYSSTPVASASVRRAADFAVADRAQTTGEAVALARIVRAEQQVVAGVNYRLCLDVTVAGKAARVLAIVYRDLKDQRKLTEWTVGGC